MFDEDAVHQFCQLQFQMLATALRFNGDVTGVDVANEADGIWARAQGNRGDKAPFRTADSKRMYESTLERCLEILNPAEPEKESP